MGTLTTSVRFTKPTVGGDTGPLWAQFTNSDWDYADQAINQQVSIAVADANVVLVADGGGTDQARYLTYVFTGALTADRTATLPANAKTGWVINSTTGGHNIVMTTGGGTTVSVPNDSYKYFFYCDGTNVSLPALGHGVIKASGFQNDASGNLYFQTTVLNPITAGVGGMAMNAGTASVIINSTAVPYSMGISSGSGTLQNFFIAGPTLVGQIVTSGGATFYNSVSDERLKIDDGAVSPSWAIDVIDALSPRMGRFKSHPDEQPWPMFMAQSVHPILEKAVTVGSGEPGEEGFVPWMMNDKPFFPVIVAALQFMIYRDRLREHELRTLRQRVIAMEGGN